MYVQLPNHLVLVLSLIYESYAAAAVVVALVLDFNSDSLIRNTKI